MADINAELKKLEKTWKKAPAKSGSQERIPEGKYPATIISASIELGKKSGKPQLVWTYKLTGGGQEGREAKKFVQLASETAIGYLKTDLRTLGLPDPKSIQQVGDVAKNAEGMDVEISIKHQRDSDKYINVWLNRAISEAPDMEEEEEEEVEDELEEDEEFDDDDDEEYEEE